MKTKIKTTVVALFFSFLAVNWVLAASPVEEGGLSASRFPIHAAFEKAPVCGNGLLEINEQCDDGNTIDSDQCSRLCEASDAFAAAGIYTGRQNDGNWHNAAQIAPSGAETKNGEPVIGPWTKTTLLVLAVIGLNLWFEIIKIPHFIRRRIRKTGN